MCRPHEFVRWIVIDGIRRMPTTSESANRWTPGFEAEETCREMSKPIPELVDPNRLGDLARAVIAEDRFPCLATIDGDQPRLRPVSPVRTDEFTVYVANLRQYHKTAEIEVNPKVELCYMDTGHNQVRLTGIAEVVTDRELLQEIWDENPLLRQYLQTIDNPQFILYRIVPKHVRYMREWALEYYDVPVG